MAALPPKAAVGVISHRTAATDPKQTLGIYKLNLMDGKKMNIEGDDAIAKLRNSFADLLNYESEDITSQIDPLAWRSPEGDTCLHYAGIRGDVASARLLLEMGVDVNETGDMGNTALHYAQTFGNTSVIEVLLEYNADTSITNEFGKRAIPE